MRKLLGILFAVALALTASTDARATNWIYDNTTTYGGIAGTVFPKTNIVPVPAGYAANYVADIDWNTYGQALQDIRAWGVGARYMGYGEQASDPCTAANIGGSGQADCIYSKTDHTLHFKANGVDSQIGGTATVSLPQAYLNGVAGPQVLALDATRVGVKLQDAPSSINADLFTVSNNAGTAKYLNVSRAGSVSVVSVETGTPFRADTIDAVTSGGTLAIASTNAVLFQVSPNGSFINNLIAGSFGTVNTQSNFQGDWVSRNVSLGLSGNLGTSSMPWGDLYSVGMESQALKTMLTGDCSLSVIGGSGATTYSYVVVLRADNGGAAPSQTFTTALGPATLTGSNYIALTCNAQAGAKSYDFYRTVGGATQGKIASFTHNGSSGYGVNDTGLTGDATTPPSGNTTGQIQVLAEASTSTNTLANAPYVLMRGQYWTGANNTWNALLQHKMTATTPTSKIAFSFGAPGAETEKVFIDSAGTITNPVTSGSLALATQTTMAGTGVGVTVNSTNSLTSGDYLMQWKNNGTLVGGIKNISGNVGFVVPTGEGFVDTTGVAGLSIASTSAVQLLNTSGAVELNGAVLRPTTDIAIAAGDSSHRFNGGFFGLSGVGTAQTVGLSLSTTTSATSGNPQDAPVFAMEGRGFNAASHTDKMGLQVQPSGSADTAVLAILQGMNGAALTTTVTVSNNGVIQGASGNTNQQLFLQDGAGSSGSSLLLDESSGARLQQGPNDKITVGGTNVSVQSVGTLAAGQSSLVVTTPSTITTAGVSAIAGFIGARSNVYTVASGAASIYGDGNEYTVDTAGVTANRLVIFSGSAANNPKVAIPAATLGLRTIVGVACTTQTSGQSVRVVQRGLVMVEYDGTAPAVGDTLKSSGTTAGRVLTDNAATWPVAVGIAAEAGGTTVAGQVAMLIEH